MIERLESIWVRCDGCGKSAMRTANVNEAYAEAYRQEWKRMFVEDGVDGTFEDRCPDCQDKQEQPEEPAETDEEHPFWRWYNKECPRGTPSPFNKATWNAALKHARMEAATTIPVSWDYCTWKGKIEMARVR